MTKLKDLDKDRLLRIIESANATIEKLDAVFKEVAADQRRFHENLIKALNETKKICEIGRTEDVVKAIDIIIEKANSKQENITLQ